MADVHLVPAITALGKALTKPDIRYMLIGGVAIVARGIRRLTDDVDATVWAALAAHGFNDVMTSREPLFPLLLKARCARTRAGV